MSEPSGVYITAPQPDLQQYSALGEIMWAVRYLQERGVDLRAANISAGGERVAAIILPGGYEWQDNNNGTNVLTFNLESAR